MKYLIIIVAALLLGSSMTAHAQVKDANRGILEAEMVGNSDIVAVTMEDGTKTIYRPATLHWDEDPVFSYRHCKGRYDKGDYFHSPLDPYIPLAAGLLGIVCPGLGHVYDGEVLRSVGYFYGTILGVGLTSTFLSAADQERYDPQYGYIPYTNNTYTTLGTICAVGTIAFYVWSVFDAVKVAKVKDLYFRDLVGSPDGLSLHVRPSLGFAPSGKPTVGLGFQAIF